MAANNHFDVPKDRFRCVHIGTNLISNLSADELSTKLPESLTKWQQDDVRGIWARVGIEYSKLIPVFVEYGFEFHHAQPDYVMMKKWISPDPDNLPPYANQYLGAAGFVVNDKNQLLVIQERYHDKKHWKLPGGHANIGEEVGEAARREVFEETGIESEFQCVICFRHMHQYRHGLSDFYFICLMKPLTHEIKKCDHEISAARWLDLEEYIADPHITVANRHFAECYKSLMSNGGYQLLPTDIMNYSKTGCHLVYSLQPMENQNEISDSH